MFSAMKVSIIIYTCAAIFISYYNSEAIEYFGRVHNFTITSETQAVYLANITIFRNYTDFRTFAIVNVTKDTPVKKIQITINRCDYEKLACENFQQWNFDGNLLKFIFCAENQMWSPTLMNFKPRFELPVIRKGIYENDNLTFDTKAGILFYSEAPNYYYKIIMTGFDNNNKKHVFSIQISFQAIEKRDQKRNFRTSTRRPPNKKKDERE